MAKRVDGWDAELPETPLLDTVNTPEELRKIEAPSSCANWRTSCGRRRSPPSGRPVGHLGSGLGVVELTTAIHYVFDTPRDGWSGTSASMLSAQILTGRRDRIRTLRQGGGPAAASPSGARANTIRSARRIRRPRSRRAGLCGGEQARRHARAWHRGDRRRVDVRRYGYEAMNNAEQAGNRLS